MGCKEYGRGRFYIVMTDKEMNTFQKLNPHLVKMMRGKPTTPKRFLTSGEDASTFITKEVNRVLMRKQ